MSRLITRGFGGNSSSLITRGYLDLFVSSEIASISFVLKTRKIEILCTSKFISFDISSFGSDFSTKIGSVIFSLSERSMLFSLMKRFIEYYLREE